MAQFGYNFESLDEFFGKCHTLFEEINHMGDGRHATQDNLAKRSNSRENLASKILQLSGNLDEAILMIKTCHAAHFTLLKDHLEMKKDRTSPFRRENQNVLVSKPKDWSKLDFTAPIAKVVKDAVKKEIRTDRILEERSKNVMVFGLNTDNDDDDDGWNTIDKCISNVLTELSLDKEDLASWEIVRSKKKENYVSYRLKFKEKCFAEKALRDAHTLIHGKYDMVFITPDRTTEQLKKHRQLVKRLKERIAERPEKRWIIKMGEIVDAGDFRTYRIRKQSIVEIDSKIDWTI